MPYVWRRLFLLNPAMALISRGAALTVAVVSTGGGYTLDGAIGQPDAGALTGGGYTLDGGFWNADSPEYAYFCRWCYEFSRVNNCRVF